MQTLLDEGCTWIVDADLKSYFDTIPKDRFSAVRRACVHHGCCHVFSACDDRLMRRVEERLADGRVLALIRSYLDQEVMEELTRHEPTDRGTPQGAVI